MPPKESGGPVPPDGGIMKKRTAIRVTTFLSAALVVTSVLAFTGMRRARQLELYTRINTSHAFDELVVSVYELSNALEKSVYATDPILESVLCSQIMARAMTGQMAAGVLPYGSQELERISTFLGKTGDYAGALARSVGEKGGYGEDELDTLQSLSETAAVLSVNLQEMQRLILAGELTMEEAMGMLRAGDGEEGVPLAGEIFQTIEAEFPEMPALIYDGPFSDALSDRGVQLLEGMEEVSAEEAKTAAARFLEVEESLLTEVGECAGDIPSRCFVTYLHGGEYTVEVTRQGGIVKSVLSSRMPGAANYSVEVALAMADDFIAGQELDTMRRSYHMVRDGVLYVNYEYDQEGVLCYPDLVKVGIALDTGELMSYDAAGYIRCHGERELPEPEISRVEAQEKVPDSLSVRTWQLAVIPSPGGEELLCHEFVCRSDNEQQYIIYVNAVTGAEEKILILLEDDSGSLTI